MSESESVPSPLPVAEQIEQRKRYSSLLRYYLPTLKSLRVPAALVVAGIATWNHVALTAFFDKNNGAIVAVATIGLFGLGYAQWQTYRAQERLARRQFVAANRPRLLVRALRLDGATDYEGTPYGLITCKIVNVGASPAAIVGGNIGSDLFTKGAPFPALPDLRTSFNTPLLRDELAILLEPGQSHYVDHKCGFNHHPSYSSQFLNRTDMHVVGVVKYTDEINVERTLAFLRRYNPKTNRFDVVEDDDYNYSD